MPNVLVFPKGPCTHIVYTVAPKYLYRDYFKAKVCTVWVHGPSGVHFRRLQPGQTKSRVGGISIVVHGWNLQSPIQNI